MLRFLYRSDVRIFKTNYQKYYESNIKTIDAIIFSNFLALNNGVTVRKI